MRASRLISLALPVVLSFAAYFWQTGTAQESPRKAEAQPVPKASPPKNGSAPLLLDDAPLLLRDDARDPKAYGGQVADNSRCYVCHINMFEEQLSVTHARTNISCVRCHGPSDAHIADESWASGGNGTPPDILITKEKINLSCFECHEPRNLSHKDHLDFLWGVAVQQFCTECHGKHRLPVRKCKWK